MYPYASRFSVRRKALSEMSLISPSVTAYTPLEFRSQLEAVSGVAGRIHFDLGDGEFTTETITPTDLSWPEGIIADVHLMYQDPLSVLDELIALRPHLVIIQSEANDVIESIEHLQLAGIGSGVAVTQQTSIESIAHIVTMVDHVLIFSGTLGSFGGEADLSLLHKVDEARLLNPDVEIGWDGGANVDNVSQLSSSGVDVIVAGGAIQRSADPAKAYAILEAQL